jgi:hypothetical protein
MDYLMVSVDSLRQQVDGLVRLPKHQTYALDKNDLYQEIFDEIFSSLPNDIGIVAIKGDFIEGFKIGYTGKKPTIRTIRILNRIAERHGTSIIFKRFDKEDSGDFQQGTQSDE